MTRVGRDDRRADEALFLRWPMLTPGDCASFAGGPLVFVVDGNIPLFPTDGGVVASPRAALSTGFPF